MYKAIDLFCGCGGMTQGLLDSGIDIKLGIDVWDKAIESYNSNFNHESICKDIREIDPESLSIKSDIDIIVGGPPCQGFSMAGRRDIKDPRKLPIQRLL